MGKVATIVMSGLLAAFAACAKKLPPPQLNPVPSADVATIGIPATLGTHEAHDKLKTALGKRKAALDTLQAFSGKYRTKLTAKLDSACDPVSEKVKNAFDLVEPMTPFKPGVTDALKEVKIGLTECTDAWNSVLADKTLSRVLFTDKEARDLVTTTISTLDTNTNPLPNPEPPSPATAGISYESAAISSIGDFVVSRAKAELLDWVASDVASKLCSVDVDHNEDVAKYFPQTCALLKGPNGEVSGDLAKFGRALQAGLQTDLNGLIARLVNSAGELQPVATAVFQLIDGVRRGQDPLALLRASGSALTCSARTKTAQCTLKLAGTALDVVVHLPTWRSVELSDQSAVDSLMGEAKTNLEAALKLQPELKAWFDSKVPTWLDQTDLLSAILTSARQIDALIVRSRNEPGHAKRQELASDLLATSIELANAATAIVMNHGDTAIVSELATLQRLLGALHDARAAFDAGDVGLFVAALTRAATTAGIDVPVPKQVRPLLPFVAAFASAKTPDEMKAALEKYAAPQGGYKEKRTRSMGSLTAFVGVAGGAEQYVTGDESTRAHLGLFAPIGLDVSCGGPSWCSGLGLMISAIDVGNVVSVGVGGGTRSPNPRLRQVLSPGLYLRWHPEALGPIAIGAGAAVVPELGAANTMDPTLSPGFKAVVFMAADVTILPF